jgi:hypothetical protein
VLHAWSRPTAVPKSYISVNAKLHNFVNLNFGRRSGICCWHAAHKFKRTLCLISPCRNFGLALHGDGDIAISKCKPCNLKTTTKNAKKEVIIANEKNLAVNWKIVLTFPISVQRKFLDTLYCLIARELWRAKNRDFAKGGSPSRQFSREDHMTAEWFLQTEF